MAKKAEQANREFVYKARSRQRRPGRHAKKPNKSFDRKPSRGQG